jgi:hypothetical protein
VLSDVVRDDCRVFGVGFSVPAVGAGGVIDGSSGDVEQRLIVGPITVGEGLLL